MSLRIVKNEINPNLKNLDEDMLRAIRRVFQFFEQVAENEMKTGARWTDQTGVARAGLVAQADVQGSGIKEFTLNFASMASYGIWLEIRWSGKYAIVGPVMNQVAPRMAKMIADIALA